MKRPLAIVGQDHGASRLEPVALRVGESGLQIADTGDGASAALFAEMLVAAGAEHAADRSSRRGDFYVLLCAPTTGSASDGRTLEREAVFVLGSPRSTFARLLVEELRSR